MAGKSNQKSVRMTDEVYQCLEDYRGEGFNEKLHNLVMDFIRGREQLVRESELLRLHIGDQREEMRRVQARLRKMQTVEQRVKPLVDAVIDMMGTV